MSSKQLAVKATRAAGPVRLASGPEAGQEETAAFTPSTQAASQATIPAMETL